MKSPTAHKNFEPIQKSLIHLNGKKGRQKVGKRAVDRPT